MEPLPLLRADAGPAASAPAPSPSPGALAPALSSLPPGPPEVLEVVTRPEALLGLREAWDDLHGRAAAPYLGQTHDWTRLAWEHVARPRGRELFCLLGRRAGRLTLAWPFAIDRTARLSVARPLDTETSEYASVLLEGGEDAVARIQAAWRVVLARGGCDWIELPNVRSDSPLHRVLSAQRRPCLTFTQDSPWTSWEGIGRWEDYHRGISGSHRSGLGRKRRRLEETGPLAFEAVTDPAALEEAADWILERKRGWMERAGLRNDWILTPEYRAFLRASHAQFGPSGRRVAFLLKRDGQIVAAELSSVDGARVEWFLGGFDEALGRFSPGQLLKEHCLRWAFERGLHYDFRIGNEPEKRIWSNRSAEAVTFRVAASLRAGLLVRAETLRRGAARRLPPAWRARIKAVLRRPRAGA